MVGVVKKYGKTTVLLAVLAKMRCKNLEHVLGARALLAAIEST